MDSKLNKISLRFKYPTYIVHLKHRISDADKDKLKAINDTKPT